MRAWHSLPVWLWLPGTNCQMMTSLLRESMRHLRYSINNIKSLHQLTKCFRCRRGGKFVLFGLNDCRKLQFSCAIGVISSPEIVSRVPPSRLYQLVQPYRLLPKSLDGVLHNFWDCAHHAAGFTMFTQFAQLFISMILNIIPQHPSQILQNSSDCLRYNSTSHWIIFLAFRRSIPHFQSSWYLPHFA